VRACLPWAFRLIRGWSNYFRIGVAREVFNDLERFMYERAQRSCSSSLRIIETDSLGDTNTA
jgi:hypothetical protein